MKKFKKFLRLLALILVIAMASIVPLPISFFRKDNLPKNLVEQIDTKEDEDEKDDIIGIF